MSNNYYEVKKGDTLWSICKTQFNLKSNSDIANKVADIARINSVFDGQIAIGQKINLGVEFTEAQSTQAATSSQEITGASQNGCIAERDKLSTPLPVVDKHKENYFKIAGKFGIPFFWTASAETTHQSSIIILNEQNKPEEVIPDGHIKAPNGKITKIYSKKEIEQIIEDVSRKHGIDSTLVRAIISVESTNNQFAKSKAGAQGLMQLMPNGAGKGLDNAYDAKANIERGVQEFARLRRFYGNNTDALRAYNYGERRYNQYLKGERANLPKETTDYPEKVLSQYQEYSKAV